MSERDNISISKAAAEYGEKNNWHTHLEFEAAHQESATHFKAGAEWRDKQVLNSPEVMAMREALEDQRMGYCLGKIGTEIEKCRCESCVEINPVLAAFDKLRGSK